LLPFLAPRLPSPKTEQNDKEKSQLQKSFSLPVGHYPQHPSQHPPLPEPIGQYWAASMFARLGVNSGGETFPHPRSQFNMFVPTSTLVNTNPPKQNTSKHPTSRFVFHGAEELPSS